MFPHPATSFFSEIHPNSTDKFSQISKPAQFTRYQKYQQEKHIPVYVVIGFGGEPNDPEMIYCIPLSEIKYPQLYPRF